MSKMYQPYVSQERQVNEVKIIVYHDRLYVIIKSCQKVFGTLTPKGDFVIEGHCPNQQQDKFPHGTANILIDSPRQ